MASALVWVSLTVLSPVLSLIFVTSLTLLALVAYEWYQETR